VIRRVLVDLGIVIVIDDVRAALVVMVMRQVIVQRDVQPRHQLEADDPQDRQHERDAPPGHRPHDAMYDLVPAADQPPNCANTLHPAGVRPR
jgi:hypothetical protein